MDLDTFIARRQPGWKSLENDLHRAEQAGLDSLPVQDLKRMGELYRAACSDLTYAKTVLQNGELSDYLNTIVGQAYAAIYRKSRFSLMGMLRWMATDYPAAVRRNGVAILVAWLVGLAGFAGAWAAVSHDRTAFEAIVPSHYHALYGKPSSDLREARFGNMGSDRSSEFSSSIYVNNIKVSFTAFALGGSFGILTLILLFYNGAMLGAIASNFHRWNMDLDFWSLIVPHGVLELSCIAVTGGAGLALGWALIRPGRLTRGESFAAAARVAVPVALGTAPLLVIAGIVEGFVTPAAAISPWAKIVLGILLGGVYWLWILLPALPGLRGAMKPTPEADPAEVSGLVSSGPGGVTRRFSRAPRVAAGESA